MNLLKNPLVKKLTVILAAIAFSILWLFLIRTGLPYLVEQGYFSRFSFTPIGIIFFSCIFAPLWEELAFRHAPLQIAKKLKKGIGVNFTWPIIIISTIIFGWGHGSGPISLLIQGVMGLTFCFVYLKNNYSYWSSVAVHSIWNFSVHIIFPSMASQYGFHYVFNI